jgi:alpha-tubulin suppressor-like RCC1 family protein
MIVGRNGRVFLLKILAGFVLALSAATPAFAQTHAAGGSDHTLILKDDGTAWAAGSNFYG